MNETIAAISSAPGEGAIGIVRISGDRSKEILSELLCREENSFEDKKLYYGTIKEPSSKQVIDEVLAVYMKKLHTYTREDVVEIYCHGSHISVRKILEAALGLGALLAAPGEFTKRAFLNGRIDLAQADAVIDVIQSRTDLGHDIALGQLEGRLSNRVKHIRSMLADALARTVVNLDYPDEDEDPGHKDSAAAEIAFQVEEASILIKELLDNADTGRMIRDGVNVVIAGRPNVGKSSLLNALLRESRAIVSDIPGTTRDRIEEYANIQGIPIKFIDTAGIRDAEAEIEQVGIDMAMEAVRGADMVLFVVDGSGKIDERDKKVAEQLHGKNIITLISKSDLPAKIDVADAKNLVSAEGIIKISVLSGEGISALENQIAGLILKGKTAQKESVLVTNIRHKNLLLRAETEAEKAVAGLRAGEPLDFIEIDIRSAYDALGEIIGETVSEDILDRVFEKFCVGK